jgi:hypothetical protein
MTVTGDIQTLLTNVRSYLDLKSIFWKYLDYLSLLMDYRGLCIYSFPLISQSNADVRGVGIIADGSAGAAGEAGRESVCSDLCFRISLFVS